MVSCHRFSIQSKIYRGSKQNCKGSEVSVTLLEILLKFYGWLSSVLHGDVVKYNSDATKQLLMVIQK